MSKPTYSGVRIVALERLNNSVNGNPRWRVALDNGVMAVSQSDAAFGYGITNPEMRGLVDVWMSRAGRISHIAESGWALNTEEDK